MAAQRKTLLTVDWVTNSKGQSWFEVGFRGGAYQEDTPHKAADRVSEILPFLAESARIDRLKRAGNYGGKRNHLWEVSFMATRPERPNLKTQVQTSVAADGAEAAARLAKKDVERSGWRVIGAPVSVLKRFRV